MIRRRDAAVASARPTVPPDTRGAPEVPAAVLLTRDRALADHVAALADAAGAPLQVLSAVGPASRAARLLLVGPDVAGDLPTAVTGGVLVVRVDGADPPDGVWRQAVQMGAERVVLLPEGEGWLVDRLVDAVSPVEPAPVIGVVGGCGGAGASSLAISLGVTAAEHGLRAVLVDADPLGGGLDLPLGAEGVEGLRWPDLPWAAGRLPAGLLDGALPRIGELRVLACTRGELTTLPVEGVAAVMDAAAREADVVVVDLPRRVDAVEVQVLRRCRRVLVVVPGSVRAAAAAALIATAVEPHVADVRVVVRGPLAPGCAAESVADALLLPLEGELRPEAGLHTALDAGEALALRPRGPLALLSRRVLTDVLSPA